MDRLPNLTAIALAALLVAGSNAHATELASAAHARGFVIHDASETLERFCRWESGRLWFELPSGARWELITSTDDPAISNRGDGAFHPYEAAEVKRALAAVRFPLAGVSAEVYVLPYPRRGGLESAAGPGLILLAPGVRPLSAAHQHAEFTHELGHVVQYARMPDSDRERWEHYAALRGFTLETHTSESAHGDRPHEIFAEDFRALFGGALANESGTIENAELALPSLVIGLESFMLSLALESDAGSVALSAPAVARGTVMYSRAGDALALLDVFDVTGRRLATLSPTVQMGSVSWAWDGRDLGGHPVQGVTFARARDGQGGAARVARW